MLEILRSSVCKYLAMLQAEKQCAYVVGQDWHGNVVGAVGHGLPFTETC